MIGQELILSKSSIDAWLYCHYAWYIANVLRIKGSPNLDMAMGTAVHAGVEAHWKGQIEGNGPHGELEAAWVAEIKLMPFDVLLGVALEPLRLATHAMLDVYLANIVPTFRPTLIEQDFLVRIDGVLVSGRLDAASVEDDSVHDTKTTTTPSKVTANDHRLGMTIYRHGFRALTGRFPKRLVLDVIGRNKRWKQAEVEPDDREMGDVVGLVASGIIGGNFEPTGVLNRACARCPYLGRSCTYGRVD